MITAAHDQPQQLDSPYLAASPFFGLSHVRSGPITGLYAAGEAEEETLVQSNGQQRCGLLPHAST